MRLWIAFGSAGSFTILALSVHLGLLNGLDSVIREWARPHDVWGPAQVRADLVVQGLQPTILAGILAALTAAYCMRRRSLQPAIFVGSVSFATVALTVVTKTVMARPYPHGFHTNAYGGSFPSGHTIGIIVFLGLVVLVMEPHAGWWIWLIPALGGALMGASLLLQAAHSSSDLLGGGLLAASVLSVASISRQRCRPRPLANGRRHAAAGVRTVSSVTSPRP
jgi:undecaprenyl-diphosphatase